MGVNPFPLMKKTNPRHRVSMDVPKQSKQLLDAVTLLLGGTMTEAFRKSLSLTHTLLMHTNKGGDVILKHKGGKTETLKLV